MSNEQTQGAVLASERDRKIRDAIEDLLDEFKNVQATGIVADEIWNRIVGPALDNAETNLKQHLRTLYAYARGFVFTDDEVKAKAMSTGQRYAAIAGLLSRLATTGVIDDDASEVSE